MPYDIPYDEKVTKNKQKVLVPNIHVAVKWPSDVHVGYRTIVSTTMPFPIFHRGQLYSQYGLRLKSAPSGYPSTLKFEGSEQPVEYADVRLIIKDDRGRQLQWESTVGFWPVKMNYLGLRCALDYLDAQFPINLQKVVVTPNSHFRAAGRGHAP